MNDTIAPIDLAWTWVDHELSEGREVTLKVTGQSMSPYIPSGSILTFTPFQSSHHSLCIGQVVYCARLRIVHRVIAQFKQRIWVKGDRLAYCDRIYDHSEITAIVTLIQYEGCKHTHQKYLTFPSNLIPICSSYVYMAYKRTKIFLK